MKKGLSRIGGARRGQNSMEYIMTYGWAILLLVAVGLSLWMLGITQPYEQMSSTARGFPTLKPFLPTCQIRNEVWRTQTKDRNGFICQFVNPTGQEIQLKDAIITVNGRNCRWMAITDKPDPYNGGGSVFRVGESSGLLGDPILLDMASSSQCDVGDLGCDGVSINANEFFWAMAISSSTTGSDFVGPCTTLDRKKVMAYDIFVDITYDINVAGITNTKHSIGTIRLRNT
jgi:hypothetical protein